MTNLLPILARGEAIIVGDSVVVLQELIFEKIELKNVDCDFSKLWSEGPGVGFDVNFVLENMRTQTYRKRT